MTKEEAKKEAARLFDIGDSNENVEKTTKYIFEKTGKSNFEFKMGCREEGKDADYEHDLMIIASLGGLK